jgi:hypothetical protein
MYVGHVRVREGKGRGREGVVIYLPLSADKFAVPRAQLYYSTAQYMIMIMLEDSSSGGTI